jgi:hypothetical protein
MPVARHRFRPCIAAHRAPRSPLTGSHHHAPSVLSASKLPRRRDTKLWVVLDRRTEPRSKYRRSTLPTGVCCSSRDDDPGTNHSTDCPLGRTAACHTQGSGEITARAALPHGVPTPAHSPSSRTANTRLPRTAPNRSPALRLPTSARQPPVPEIQPRASREDRSAPVGNWNVYTVTRTERRTVQALEDRARSETPCHAGRSDSCLHQQTN